MNSYNVFYFGEWLGVANADTEQDAKRVILKRAQAANLNLKLEHMSVQPLSLSLFATA